MLGGSEIPDRGDGLVKKSAVGFITDSGDFFNVSTFQ